MYKLHIVAISALLWSAARAQVSGTPFGFASGVTGGGDVTPVYPTTIDELEGYLTDDDARVIMVEGTFDFTESQGIETAKGCKKTAGCSDGSAGQSTITDTCDSTQTEIDITYYVAAKNPIKVASNKSLVGVGSDASIKGRGLILEGGVSNIIIQNIFFTDVNPQYVWGGDLLTLDNCDNVWIDHNKFSLAGRQFIVSGFDMAGHVTISNNEFDGVTDYSTSCDGKHYWVLLLAGAEDYYTFAGNYIHDTSGRGPHIGTTVDKASLFFHAYNNLWKDIDGHAFDIDAQTNMLLEGNIFNNVKTPMTSTSSTTTGGIFDTPSSSDASSCQSYLGRDCVINTFESDSGDWVSVSNTTVLGNFKTYKSLLATPETASSSLESDIKASAGVGKIASSGTTVTSSTVASTSSSPSIPKTTSGTSKATTVPTATTLSVSTISTTGQTASSKSSLTTSSAISSASAGAHTTSVVKCRRNRIGAKKHS